MLGALDDDLVVEDAEHRLGQGDDRGIHQFHGSTVAEVSGNGAGRRHNSGRLTGSWDRVGVPAVTALVVFTGVHVRAEATDARVGAAGRAVVVGDGDRLSRTG
ncbi:hypothetical protein Q0Z83_096440 [Actinoplanes sichuanensis]|nr:hypothetical protein Q0Z83_096440 [Actinoplanes sichuanensis]